MGYRQLQVYERSYKAALAVYRDDKKISGKRGKYGMTKSNADEQALCMSP